jgi:hypothetical protein
MPAGNMNRSLLERYRGESAAKLINLRKSSVPQFDMERIVLTYPIYQFPIPTFHQEWEFAKQATDQSILEHGSVWTEHPTSEPLKNDVALSPGAFLEGKQ